MSELSLSGLKNNTLKYGTPVVAALALVACGAASEKKDPNAVGPCPESYPVGQEPLRNPGEFLQYLAANAKHYKIKIGTPGEELCGDTKTQKIYYSPDAAAVLGLIHEAKRKELAAKKEQ
jgi:hypothetical protein